MRRGEEATKEKPVELLREIHSDDESRGDSARNIIARNRIKGSNILIYELATPSPGSPVLIALISHSHGLPSSPKGYRG